MPGKLFPQKISRRLNGLVHRRRIDENLALPAAHNLGAMIEFPLLNELQKSADSRKQIITPPPAGANDLTTGTPTVSPELENISSLDGVQAQLAQTAERVVRTLPDFLIHLKLAQTLVHDGQLLVLGPLAATAMERLSSSDRTVAWNACLKTALDQPAPALVIAKLAQMIPKLGPGACQEAWDAMALLICNQGDQLSQHDKVGLAGILCSTAPELQPPGTPTTRENLARFMQANQMINENLGTREKQNDIVIKQLAGIRKLAPLELRQRHTLTALNELKLVSGSPQTHKLFGEISDLILSLNSTSYSALLPPTQRFSAGRPLPMPDHIAAPDPLFAGNAAQAPSTSGRAAPSSLMLPARESPMVEATRLFLNAWPSALSDLH